MNIRDSINKRTRFVMWTLALVGFTGVGAFVSLLSVDLVLPAFSALALLIVAILVLQVMLFTRSQCPKCGGILIYLSNYGYAPFTTIPKKVKFCPLCSQSLEVEEADVPKGGE